MKNSFKELQNIYEEYRGDISDWSKQTYGMKDLNTASMSQTYPKGGLPGAQPGQGTSVLTTPVCDDEEEQTDNTAFISKQLVIKMINELLEDATERGMSYAQEHLFNLLRDVKNLKSVTIK